jgi:hypothetical protein
MQSKQDGQGIPPYASETAREIRTLGAGGEGNTVNKADARRRGVNPKLVADSAERARLARQRDAGAGGSASSDKSKSPQQTDKSTSPRS